MLRDVTDLHALENMRRDFVANVSHELKTPLASIKAYAETLRMGAINDADKNLQFVGQIETQAELLNLQIQDLLEIARIESGTAAFNVENVDISHLCKQSVENLQAQAAQREVQLLFEAGETPLIATAESNGVTTIVNNLVSNAIRYTPADGQVTVATRREADWVIDRSEGHRDWNIPKNCKRGSLSDFYRVDTSPLSRSRWDGTRVVNRQTLNPVAGRQGGTGKPNWQGQHLPNFASGCLGILSFETSVQRSFGAND